MTSIVFAITDKNDVKKSILAFLAYQAHTIYMTQNYDRTLMRY